MAAIFQKEVPIRFSQSDQAGIMFFGNIFGLAHDCFEDFLTEAGLAWKEYFRNPEFIVPIRHTECNFLRPFFPGSSYLVQVSVRKMSETTFQMQYVFLDPKTPESPCAELRMVHTFLEAKTKKKTKIPEKIRVQFSKYLEAPNA